MEHNDEKVSVGAAEDRDVHGDGGRVRLVEPHPEVPLPAQQEEDEDPNVHQAGFGLVHPGVVDIVEDRDDNLQDVTALEDMIEELSVVFAQLPEQN